MKKVLVFILVIMSALFLADSIKIKAKHCNHWTSLKEKCCDAKDTSYSDGFQADSK